MALFETVLVSDLKKPIQVKALTGNLFSADNNGNKITVSIMDNGAAAEITGNVTGYVIRADGKTVVVDGELVGNMASIVLPASAYAVIGRVSIVVKVGATTVGACTSNVYRSTTDEIVDPGTVIPSITALMEQIAAAIEEVEDVVDSIPPDYTELVEEVNNKVDMNHATQYTPSNSATFDYGTWYHEIGTSYIARLNDSHAPADPELVSVWQVYGTSPYHIPTSSDADWLVYTFADAMEHINDFQNNIADIFYSGVVYEEGHYVTRNGVTYKRKSWGSTTPVAKAWSASDWEKVEVANDLNEKIGSECSALKSAFIQFRDDIGYPEYVYQMGWVNGRLSNTGEPTSQPSKYKTIGDYIPVVQGTDIHFIRNVLLESYSLTVCEYDTNKAFISDTRTAPTATYDYIYKVKNASAKYLRFSVSNTVSSQVLVYNDSLEYAKNLEKMQDSYDDLFGNIQIDIEQGNIKTNGQNETSDINVRTKDYLPDVIKCAECEGSYRFCVMKYSKLTGANAGRSGFLYTYYADFDHSTYLYRLAYVKKDNSNITPSVASNFSFFTRRQLDNEIYNSVKNGSASVEIEAGNIKTNGNDEATTRNLRTAGYLPGYVTSVQTMPGYNFCIDKITKSSGSHYGRTSYGLTEYTEIDHSTYLYRVAMQKDDGSDISLSEKTNLKLNVPVLHEIHKATSDIISLQSYANDNDLTKIPLLNDYLNENGYNIVSRTLKGVGAGSGYTSGGFDITDSEKNSHDATICIKNDKVYCVRALYEGSGDNASNENAAVVLTICDIDGSNMQTINVAKKGDTLGSYTVAGGCGSPNLFLSGTDIHIYFTAHITDDYTIFHCVYDTENNTLDDYEPITIDGETCGVSLINSLLGLSYSAGTFNAMQMNASIAIYSDIVYAGLCAGTAKATGRGMIISSDDFVNWETFVVINKKIITPIYEIACCAYNGYLYIMARSVYDDLKGYIAKYKISDKSLVQHFYLINGCSRPDFIIKDNKIYLFNLDDAGRTVHSIIAINTTNINRSVMIVQAQPVSEYQYFRGFVYNSKIYASSTQKGQNNLYQIHINEFDMNTVTDNTVLSALQSLIT